MNERDSVNSSIVRIGWGVGLSFNFNRALVGLKD